MKTQVEMKRAVLDRDKVFNFESGVIKQQSKTGFFSATDLIRIGNEWRARNNMHPFVMNNWLNSKATKEFMRELENKFGKIKITARGRGSNTWVHPYLFIDMALAINPRLKVEVYGWIHDHLIEYRNDSGDSWKKMAGALWAHAKVKSRFSKDMMKLANLIKHECGVVGTWQEANAAQLKLRDKIHNSIALLADVLSDNKQAVRLGILKTKNLE